MIKKKIIKLDRKTGQLLSEEIVDCDVLIDEATFYDPLCKILAESFLNDVKQEACTQA